MNYLEALLMDKSLEWDFLDRSSTKVVIALERLDRPYAQEVSSKAGISFEETVNLLNKFSVKGIATSTVERGKRNFELTPLGEALSKKLLEIDNIFEKWPGRDKNDKIQFKEMRLKEPFSQRT